MTMNKAEALRTIESLNAVGSQVDRGVRPCAQVPVHPRQGRLWANVRPAGAETPVPSYRLDNLYDQAAIDAARMVAERERYTPLMRAAGRVLQAFDDGYLQPDPETLQGGLAVDELREAWRALVPARI